MDTRAELIQVRLHRAFGEPLRPPRLPPVDELVKTILSQNTNDRNRDRAFKALRERFQTWEEVLHISLDELADIIAPAGLGPTKSRWIHDILRQVYRDGDEELLDLCKLPQNQAMKRLLSMNGVGPKTASCVLLFSCGHKVFPVDTHIFRVAKKLGLLPEKTDRVKAHEVLGRTFPPERYLELHLNMIRLGRELCRPSTPLCEKCPLVDICPSSQTMSLNRKGKQRHE